ncbi:MAG: hypothetical protein FJX77_02660, partial [Armatimonadetes bacterium]|nr:hypothetical protein [Armatimonadota bacterium]
MRNLHRERTLYQEAIELSVRACRLAESCGEVGVVRLGSQLSRAAVLVPTLIARSYAPLTGDALSEHLDRVESALLELETLLVLSVRLGRVSQPEAAAVLANLDGVRVELWLEQQRAEVAREEQAPALTVPDPVEPAGRRAPAAPVAASLPEPPAPAPESAPTRAQAVPILPEPGPAPSEAPPQAPVGASARPARAPEPAASSAPAILTPEPLPSPPPVPASPLAAHRVGPEPTQAGPPTSTPARPTEPPAAHPESPPPRSVPPKTLLPSSASARPAPRE